MDCRSRISAGKNTAFSNFREKAANRSRSPDLCIRGGERLLGVAPMADFRLAPGLCTYSGGTVPELHRIVYSPPTPDRRRGHSGFDKNMIRQFRSFVKKAGGIAAKQWFVARASVGGATASRPLGRVQTGFEQSRHRAGSGTDGFVPCPQRHWQAALPVLFRFILAVYT